MSWQKVVGKFVKGFLFGAAGGAVAAIQASGGEPNWAAVASSAIYAGLVAGAGHGGVNAAKHAGAP